MPSCVPDWFVERKGIDVLAEFPGELEEGKHWDGCFVHGKRLVDKILLTFWSSLNGLEIAVVVVVV